MSTILFAFLAACVVCPVIFIAAGLRWRQNKDRLLKADEGHLDAACEGAIIRDLSDISFSGANTRTSER